MGMNDNSGAPAPAEPSATSPAPVDSGVNWAELATDVDDAGGFVIEPLEPSPSGTPDPQVAPQVTDPNVQTPAVAATPPADQHPSQPVVTAPLPQSPVQPQVASPEPSAPTNPVELEAQYREQLSKEYAVNDDDALAFSTTPETIIPKFAANLHMRIMRDVVGQIRQVVDSLPQIMQSQVERVQAEESAKREFYGEWPGLAQHHDRVLANAVMVRQANPMATKQQVIEMAGMMTAVAMGMDPATVRRQAGAQQQQPRMPQAQPQFTRPAGLTPATNGASVGPDNVFGQFADEDADWMR